MKSRITSQTISEKIIELLEQRGIGKSICPSEVARALDKTGWESHMSMVREVADKLRAERKIEITQKHVLLHSAIEAKGPIRLRLPKASGSNRA